MILWFAGGACLAVWLVFSDPRIDYRLVVAGAFLPDVVDGVLGGARVLHSLLASVVVLFGVMLLTRQRRGLRRRLLAVPIGMFLHLALDGMWTQPDVFWWPFFGSSFADAPLPSLERSGLVVVVQEAAGAVALLWCWAQVRAGRVAASGQC